MNKKPKGKRYSSFTKSMYEVVKIWGGERLVKFLSINLDVPDARTVRQEVQKNISACQPGFQDLHLSKLKTMYRNLMAQYNIKSVLVEQAEDETAIIKPLTYNQSGFCGESGDHHQCTFNYTRKVGDDDNAYEKLVGFFSSKCCCEYGSCDNFQSSAR